jgi:hypothetical protein
MKDTVAVAEATTTLWALADDVLLHSLGWLEGDPWDLDRTSHLLSFFTSQDSS